jgi:hypothetical protein
MKRTRSSPPASLASKKQNNIARATDLTYDALRKHDKSYQPLSPYKFFDMVMQEKTPSLADILSILSPSIRSL